MKPARDGAAGCAPVHGGAGYGASVRLLLLLAVALISSCGAPALVEENDGGVRGDGGTLSVDAGANADDGGVLDSGTLDAGSIDSGTPDAGTSDAGSLDSGTPDAGAVDSGSPDAGALDAGTTVPDAGSLDGGTPALDSGTIDAGFVDPCATQLPACPAAPANLVEHGGLRTIDRCAFPISLATGAFGNDALLDALALRSTPVTVAQVIADTNRIATSTTTAPGAPAGVAYAFRWNAEDEASTTWIPQGITGSADADPSGLVGGRRVVLVSWYEDAGLQKGVRIAFVDITTPGAPEYRFALLVEPTGTPAAPNFTQVDAHAGGIVWYGPWLYMAQTGSGFRVFDLRRILQVATDVDVVGCTATTCRAGLYKYVIPQVAAYVDRSTCNPLFSWVSLDRGSSPPALVSGEYCSGTACTGPLAGRVFRWPLDPATGLLRGARTWPVSAAYMGQRQVQGGATRLGTTYLSSSAPAGGGGALYSLNTLRSLSSNFVDSPEDLMVDEANGVLWSLSEAAGARVVLSVRFTSYPVP